ncbi:four helix bundle protein [Roseimaritima ulvae]|uniref:Four helix bundle protein n=1 Tax=Roseimaritima ulvae TaxID=980254 RepID=A0A5B9R5N5_9BACT|nr:four helix bundle protein [Roseimaritima ulvae]QEG41841.1 hypothetical protein UC8_38690 [Roseimaritima ulvae]
MSDRIYSHRDLIVYQKSFAAGKRIFELSRSFPREEMYSLTDQVRRSSRSVSANIAEAWRKRRYERHFCSTLNIAEAEAAETQVWLEYAAAHGYLDQKTAKQANDFYDEILRMIVSMIASPEKWCVGREDKERGRQGVKEQGTPYVFAEAPEIDQSDLISLSPALRVSLSEKRETSDA